MPWQNVLYAVVCPNASNRLDCIINYLRRRSGQYHIYGKSFYNILTFKKDTCGLDGVVSFEGTLWGIAGSAMIAILYIAFYGYSTLAFWILLAGFAGNIADSVLGASVERRGWLKNDAVNLLNTLIATAVGVLGYWL